MISQDDASRLTVCIVQQILFIGGAPYKEKQKLNEWFSTVPENPVIIKYTLQSIFNLLTTQRFPNDSAIDTKSQHIMRALEQYINKTTTVYCENQCTNERQGSCRPLGAFGYGLCECFHGYTGFDCSRPIPSTTGPIFHRL